MKLVLEFYQFEWINNDKVIFVGTKKATGPNQQQGTSSCAQTPGRCSTP
jgi:uncharacterized protein YabE (DUF348 family)